MTTTEAQPSTSTRIGPELARSWLLVNATHVERFDAAVASAADVVILDIEDAVAPKDKETARQNVVDFFERGGEAWVRINGFGTEWWEADCKALAQFPNCLGVMLAMVESPEHVIKTAGLLSDSQKIVALVETARGVQHLDSIAASRSTFRLAFGIGDFRRDTGFADDPMTLAYARSQFTIAARAAGLPGPIDGPAVGALGVKLADAAAVTEQFGMTGKICLMPEQCATVNEILSPSLEDMSWALDFLTEFDADGGEIRNGSDLPRLARARKVLDLAAAYGLKPPAGYDVHFPAPTDTYHC
ncbi:CoA ester lyase [Mariniluteicoccus endophyticus]